MEPIEHLVMTVQAAIERGRRRAALLGAGLFGAGVAAGVVLSMVARGT